MTIAYRFAVLVKLGLELGRWRRLGIRPRLWWRDDDAREPSAALDRLLQLADGRPLALAVIPDGDLDALSARLSLEHNLAIGQHGVNHINRRPAGETPSEYPAPPTAEEIAERVAGGSDRMRRAGLAPTFYTPPWNAIDPGLGRAVSRAGIPVLSAGPTVLHYADLVYMASEADVTAWKGAARFKGALRIMSALQQAMQARRQAGDLRRSIGLLTHHLAHDEATWRFLTWGLPVFDRLFDWVAVTGQPHAGARAADVRTAGARIEPMAQPRPV
jgi:hypothetical protein